MSRTGTLLLVAIAGLSIAGYCHQAAEVSELTGEIAALRRGRGDLGQQRWAPVSAPAVQRVRPTDMSDESARVARSNGGGERGAETHGDEPHRDRRGDDEPGADGDGIADDRADRAARWNVAVQRSRAAIEVRYRGESVDASWAVGADRDLRDRIADALPATASVGSLDCRSSLCRAALRVRDTADVAHLTQQLLGNRDAFGWSGPAVVLPPQPSGDGWFDVVMFLGRDGTQLPVAP